MDALDSYRGTDSFGFSCRVFTRATNFYGWICGTPTPTRSNRSRGPPLGWREGARWRSTAATSPDPWSGGYSDPGNQLESR